MEQNEQSDLEENWGGNLRLIRILFAWTYTTIYSRGLLPFVRPVKKFFINTLKTMSKFCNFWNINLIKHILICGFTTLQQSYNCETPETPYDENLVQYWPLHEAMVRNHLIFNFIFLRDGSPIIGESTAFSWKNWNFIQLKRGIKSSKKLGKFDIPVDLCATKENVHLFINNLFSKLTMLRAGLFFLNLKRVRELLSLHAAQVCDASNRKKKRTAYYVVCYLSHKCMTNTVPQTEAEIQLIL